MGTTTFDGFQVSQGKFLRPTPPRRHLEAIGDSITCGFGNEGHSANEAFSIDTENGYMSYACIAARKVDSEVEVIAWSGRKMWPDNTMPEIYDLSVATDPTSTYAFDGPKPDAILINLATNDFGKSNPEEKPWTYAYSKFIERLRTHYPDAMIYTAIGSMMSDAWPPKANALSTLRGYLTRMVARWNAAGDKRVKLIEFPVQDQANGIGAAYHPSVKTDEIMAAKWDEALRRDLGW